MRQQIVRSQVNNTYEQSNDEDFIKKIIEVKCNLGQVGLCFLLLFSWKSEKKNTGVVGSDATKG